jgi:hypothetical protein
MTDFRDHWKNRFEALIFSTVKTTPEKKLADICKRNGHENTVHVHEDMMFLRCQVCGMVRPLPWRLTEQIPRS